MLKGISEENKRGTLNYKNMVVRTYTFNYEIYGAYSWIRSTMKFIVNRMGTQLSLKRDTIVPLMQACKHPYVVGRLCFRPAHT